MLATQWQGVMRQPWARAAEQAPAEQEPGELQRAPGTRDHSKPSRTLNTTKKKKTEEKLGGKFKYGCLRRLSVSCRSETAGVTTLMKHQSCEGNARLLLYREVI